jgi:hypothetical protein
MDRESLQLFQFGTEAFRREVAPVYEQVRQDFMAHLALESTTLADLIEQEKQAKQNVLLVQRFVNTLPTPSRNDNGTFKFKLANEGNLHGIISSVIWQPGWIYRGNEKRKSLTPHYVVGVAHPGKYLVAHASTARLYVIQPKKKEDALIKETLNKALQPLDMSVVKAAFQADHLVVDGHMPGCAVSKALNSPYLEPKTQLSDSEIAAFDVLSRLNTLATLFDKRHELDSIVENYGNLAQ